MKALALLVLSLCLVSSPVLAQPSDDPDSGLMLVTSCEAALLPAHSLAIKSRKTKFQVDPSLPADELIAIQQLRYSGNLLLFVAVVIRVERGGDSFNVRAAHISAYAPTMWNPLSHLFSATHKNDPEVLQPLGTGAHLEASSNNSEGRSATASCTLQVAR